MSAQSGETPPTTDAEVAQESQQQVPEGFEQLGEGLGFSDSLQPFYRCIRDGQARFGLFVRKQHLNLMDICHGGTLMTLADIAAATSIHLERDIAAPSPTITLSFDFMSPGKPGRWLETRADHVQVKRRFGFCSGGIYDGDTAILRYSGTFYFPDHAGLSVKAEDSHKLRQLMGHDDA